jgi:DNA-binding response OmpR family regulator
MLKILVVKEGNTHYKQMCERIEAFGRQNDVALTLLVASDPKEAVRVIISTAIDIVFIGVSEANAQSFYALGIIRKHSRYTLIAAISDARELLRDEAYILESGAEFCIAEPVDMDLFGSRIEHYFSLVRDRKNNCLSSIYNCLNTHVHSYKSLFVIENEENITEFWEHCSRTVIITDTTIGKTIHALYQIATQALHKGYKPIILMEYTDETIYFTMSGIEQMNSRKLHSLLDQQITRLPIKIVRDRFTIAVAKQPELSRGDSCDAGEAAPHRESSVQPSPPNNENIHSALTKSPPKAPHKEVFVCDYIDEEDLSDIKEYLSKLKSLLLMVSNGDLEEEEVGELIHYLGGIGKIASAHNESYSIGMAISSLARTIDTNEREFREKSSALGELCIAYGNDLETWIRLVFEEGTHDVYCMDESIIFNSTMLCDAIVATEGTSAPCDQELDDIFDF